jgi:MFS family permease
MPARLRGRLDLAINATYWLGAAVGAAATFLLLSPALLPIDIGWRLGFAIGAGLALIILLLRRVMPESPRWLVTHGQREASEDVMADIERRVVGSAGAALPETTETLTIHPRESFGIALVLRMMLGKYRARSCLVLVLMAAQAFLFNGLFFTYALVMVHYYNVNAARVGIYLLPLIAGNFLGPLLLGRFFDTVGRRIMIAGTYLVSGVLMAVTAYLFAIGAFDEATQTCAWMVVFFFASAAASAAYLTASEVFPLEMRAMAIAVFYALGTAVGGIGAPLFFGVLIGTGSRWALFAGYLAAALLMLIAAGVAAAFGIDSERRSLEEIAPPLSANEV